VTAVLGCGLDTDRVVDDLPELIQAPKLRAAKPGATCRRSWAVQGIFACVAGRDTPVAIRAGAIRDSLARARGGILLRLCSLS
jgi:hypothetical protein